MNNKQREINYLEQMTFDINTDLLTFENYQSLYLELKKPNIDYNYIFETYLCPSFYIGLCIDHEYNNDKSVKVRARCIKCWKKALE